MIDPEHYEKSLRSRLDVLRARMMEVEDRLDDRPDPDVEERSVEREDDEVLERIGTAALEEAHQIEAALARIAEGRFGVCVACGGSISVERLDAVPHAPRCRKCVAQ